MNTVLDHELVNKTTNLLSILSKKDALSIFLLAKDGLRAETDTPEKIGLTRKQYYTRLKQLVDTGLIDKSGDVYVHTTLGTFVHQQHLLGLLEHIRNVKQMKMVDTLKRTRQFSEDEIANFVGKLTGSSITSSEVPKIKISWSYEDMISTSIDEIQLCKSEIFLASRFANDVVINNMTRKADAGLHIKIIADLGLVESFITSAKDKLAMNDKNSIERLNVTGNPWYPKPPNIGRKFMHIPYSIVIFDGKKAGVEIIDRNEPNKYSWGILVEDKTFVSEIKKVFNSWWEIAKEDNLTEILKNSVPDKS